MNKVVKTALNKIVVFLKLIGAKFKYKLRDNSNIQRVATSFVIH